MENTLTLQVETKGEVISSNFPQFQSWIRKSIKAINTKPSTDEEFGQAELDVKSLQTAEKTLKEAKESALKQASDVYELLEKIDGLNGELSSTRLNLKKAVDRRKDEIKDEILAEHLAMFDVESSKARQHFTAPLKDAIKGKRFIDTMRSACAEVVEAAQKQIDECRSMLESFAKAHGESLIMDKRELELWKSDLLESELRRRFEAKKAQDEAAKLREEKAKAEAEAKAAQETNTKPESNQEEAETAPEQINPEPVAKPAEANLSAFDEWKGFADILFASFAQLREYREKMQHPENLKKAEAFAAKVNGAWKEVSK